MTMHRYTFDFAFTVQSPHASPDKVTGRALRAALLRRAKELPDSEMLEACGYIELDESDEQEARAELAARKRMDHQDMLAEGERDE